MLLLLLHVGGGVGGQVGLGQRRREDRLLVSTTVSLDTQTNRQIDGQK